MTSTLPPIVQAFSGAIGSVSANTLTYPLDLVTTRLQLWSPQKSKRHGGISGAALTFRHIFKDYGIEALYDGLWADSCATLLAKSVYTRRLIGSGGSTKAKSSVIYKPSMIEELILGFIAGVASRVVSTPLNIVTLKLQTEREDVEESVESRSMGMTDIIKSIYKDQGLVGFWRGFQTSILLSLNPSITLAFFQMYRRLLTLAKSSRFRSVQAATRTLNLAPPSANLRPWEAFFGGAISNSIAVILLYPLILGKKRVQVSSSATIQDVLVDAYRGEDILASGNLKRDEEKAEDSKIVGVKGLYQGLQMKIITVFLSQGVTFLVKGRIEQLVIAAYLARLRGTTGGSQ
ncbi:hypothetical protein CVT25_008650 [Psilocybe cyanescens]|uniref:Uncharacterized protein n=1 Tax=Psilocybe cyanescens TaxID=93625 RepID=A0A409XNQ9_PSICY|nr:hypothetical protein CVT25_008650 [Psilocybe cyanescens]